MAETMQQQLSKLQQAFNKHMERINDADERGEETMQDDYIEIVINDEKFKLNLNADLWQTFNSCLQTMEETVEENGW